MNRRSFLLAVGATACEHATVVEESGAVRWRAEVPKSFNPDGALTAGFVAISDRRVVFVTAAPKLFAQQCRWRRNHRRY